MKKNRKESFSLYIVHGGPSCQRGIVHVGPDTSIYTKKVTSLLLQHSTTMIKNKSVISSSK